MTIPIEELEQRAREAVEGSPRDSWPVKRPRQQHELPPRNPIDPMVLLNILSIREPQRAREAFSDEFGIELDVQAVAEAFEHKIIDAICSEEATIESPLLLAGAVAVLLKSAKRSRLGPPDNRGGRPRKSWRDRLTYASAVQEARAQVAAGKNVDRVAHKTVEKFKPVLNLKNLSSKTLKAEIQRRKPRTGK